MEADDKATAASKVFAVPELLENILLNLPFHTLFAVQRVDSNYKEVIAGSVVIQRQMFLEPSKPTNDFKLSRIFGKKKVKRATSPFLLLDGTFGCSRTEIDAELECAAVRRIERHEDTAQSLWSKHGLLDSESSWRRIAIGQHEAGLLVAISCEAHFWLRGYSAAGIVTLGDIIEKAKALLEKAFTLEWDFRCEEGHNWLCID